MGGTQGDPYYYNDYPGCTGNNCVVGLISIDNSTGLCPMPRPSLIFTCPVVGYGGEEVWNEPQAGFGAATGGASSLLFATPSYQSGLGLTSRTTPDVSYNAAISGGVLVVAFGGVYVGGGTSAGSPQWAGIFAIVNQQAKLAGRGPIGFANPLIYALAESSAYSSDFHDITVGNNGLWNAARILGQGRIRCGLGMGNPERREPRSGPSQLDALEPEPFRFFSLLKLERKRCSAEIPPGLRNHVQSRTHIPLGYPIDRPKQNCGLGRWRRPLTLWPPSQTRIVHKEEGTHEVNP